MNKTVLLGATALVALTAGAATGSSMHPGVRVSTPSVKLHPLSLKHRPGPGGGNIFWLQDSPNGSAYVTDNFSDFPGGTYDSQLADDFTFPGTGGSGCAALAGVCAPAVGNGITEVAVEGGLYGWTGPVQSIDVYIYKNNSAQSRPKNNPYYSFLNLPITNTFAQNTCSSEGQQEAFYCYLPYANGSAAAKLKDGHTYWLSVVANMSFAADGEWYWDLNPPITIDPAFWRNPGNGFETGCTNWRVGGVNSRLSQCFGITDSDLVFLLAG